MDPISGKTYVSNTYIKIACRISLENWLWKVYHVPQRHQLELILPDFLTPWEIRAVGVSNKENIRILEKVCKDEFPAINNSVTRVNEKG
ncbi:hypothetical protein CapIbe_008098 [Capra ibex]